MKTNNRGNTLIVVLILMTTLVSFVGVAVHYTQGVARNAQRDRTNVGAQAIGDGCLELLYAGWRQVCERTPQAAAPGGDPNQGGLYTVPYMYNWNKQTPPPTDAFANVTLPTAAMFANVPGINTANFATRGPRTAANETVSNYMVQAIDPSSRMTTADPPLSTIPTTQQPPYGNALDWHYLASADITLPTPGGMVTTKMRRVFEKKRMWPQSCFLFFNDDLELHPNSTSPLTLGGRIHTNATLYTGSSSLTLNAAAPKLTSQLMAPVSGPLFTGGFSYADNWVKGFKPGDPAHLGTPAAPIINASPSPAPVRLAGPQRTAKFWPFGITPNQLSTVDANPNNDDYHELIEKPVAGQPDPFGIFTATSTNCGYNCGSPPTIAWPGSASPLWSKARYYERAGLRIDISSSTPPTVTIRNRCGETLYSSLATSPPASKGPTYVTAPENTQPGYWGWAWAVDMWKTALGVAPTAAALSPASSTIGRTSGAIGRTTAGSTTLTTTSSFFLNGNPKDVGQCVTGTGIPANTTITAYTSGTSVTMSNAATVTGTGRVLNVSSFTTITDNRETVPVDLITLNIDVFKNWDPSGHNAPIYTYPDNRRRQTDTVGSWGNSCDSGAVHISIAQVAGRRRALRIKNGATFDKEHVDPGNTETIWSYTPFGVLFTDAPLYIQGDYGSNSTNVATAPPSNTNAGPRTSVGEVAPYSGNTRVVAADAITVLSNNWQDKDSALGVGTRVASNTTINGRFITGDVPTTSTAYSGGGENLIRLLENWTGKYLTFSGFQCQLYHSKVATGTWGKANVYIEPTPSGAGANGGRFFYQEPFTTIDGNIREYTTMFGYLKHEWSPTP